MFFSTIWAYLMPSVTNSIYFHNEKSKPTDEPPPNYTSSTGEPKTTEDIESQPSKTKVGNNI